MYQCPDIGKIVKRPPYTVHGARHESESAAHRPLVLRPQVVIGDDGRDVDWGELPEMLARVSAPPDGLPIYRVLTGPDDAAFCRRVSDAIGLGHRLTVAPR
jgi:hypothetical protein